MMDGVGLVVSVVVDCYQWGIKIYKVVKNQTPELGKTRFDNNKKSFHAIYLYAPETPHPLSNSKSSLKCKFGGIDSNNYA